MRKVTHLECKFINDLFHIRDSSYTNRVLGLRRLYAFQARDFLHTFNATYIGAFDTLFSFIIHVCILLMISILIVNVSSKIKTHTTNKLINHNKIYPQKSPAVQYNDYMTVLINKTVYTVIEHTIFLSPQRKGQILVKSLRW